jgi:hypothetical protein
LLMLHLLSPLLALLVSSDSLAQALAPALESACRENEVSCLQRMAADEIHASEATESAGHQGPGIQDNSFLVEEAYNQEFGVVQHIQSFQRLWNSKDWVYTFTQEWPVDPIPRHQLSYTLLFLHSGGYPRSAAGIGDMVLNYRYQLIGNGKSRFAFAPRISALLPAGRARLGRGVGSTGIQTMLPVSVSLSKKLVAHWNCGASFVPEAHNAFGERAAMFGYNFGQSLVWLAHRRFNVLLETVISRNQDVVSPNRTEWSSTVLLNPGIRWAYNFKSGLQIVPGLGVPVGIGPSSGERGIFLYLSFEHPYRHVRQNGGTNN